MKLENMDVVTSSNDSESITPDVNLMSDEFNFSPISEEARESGDGDSGAESKENPEFDKTHNNYHAIKDSQTDVIIDSQDPKKLKDKRVSKIPVRQVKLPFVSKVPQSNEDLAGLATADESGAFAHKNANSKSLANYDNTVRDLAEVCENGTAVGEEVSERYRLPILGGLTSIRSNTEDANGIQTGLNPSEALLERRLIEQSFQDFRDIFKDLSTNHDTGDVGSAFGFTSLSPRAPLASDDLDVPILEAPEEFRCLGEEVGGEQVDIGEPEDRHTGSSYRDCDNACSTETGDTNRRAVEEDEGDARQIRTVEVGKSASSCASHGASDHALSECSGAVAAQHNVGPSARAGMKGPAGNGRDPRAFEGAETDIAGTGDDHTLFKCNGVNNVQVDSRAIGGTTTNVGGTTSSDHAFSECSGAVMTQHNVGPSIRAGMSGSSRNDAVFRAKGNVGTTRNDYEGRCAAATRNNADTGSGGSSGNEKKSPKTNVAGTTNEVLESAECSGAVAAQHDVGASARAGMNGPEANERDRRVIEGAKTNIASSSIGSVECAGEGDAENLPGSPESGCDVCVRRPCADQPTGPSIEIGVAKCAQASGCSRVSTAKVCVALDPGQQNSICADPRRTKNGTDSADGGSKAQANSKSRQNLGAFRLNESETSGQHSCENSDVNSPASEHLSWRFKDGRLVFDENHGVNSEAAETNRRESAEVGENDSDEQSDSQDNDEINKVLYSKHLNKRIDENRSRLKYLEQKLKEAGITDEESSDELAKSKNVDVDHKSKKCKTIEQVVDKSSTIQDNKGPDYDANQNILKNQKSVSATEGKSGDSENDVEIPEGTDTVDFTAGDFCEFDVRQVDTFSGFNGYWEVYDELDDDSDCEKEHHLITRVNIANNMGIDGERAKHNPDRDNLKSLLKRPGKGKDKRSNRVVFNENKNEFFDADYIILIREECDYDDEDDDGVCTCNQHEMVRLTCCEPNCNCNVYDGYDQTPQSPKFAPPLEFVDAVTLSPPEGYKDMELEEQQLLALQQIARRGQRTAVCRECSVAHDDVEDEGDGSQSDNETCGEINSDHEEQEEKEKTDQSQQTTPTTPPNDPDSPNSQRYILETITMTTVTEQRILREVEDERKTPTLSVAPGGSPINGILKGGKLWKQQSVEMSVSKPPEPQQTTESSVASDEEGSSRRSVRFIESEQNKRDSCDGAPDNSTDENTKTENSNSQPKQSENCNSSVSPESTEMMLTFKLGNHVLISNNSLKPNSAVRQLFPCTKQLNGKAEDESIHQYLVTAESLRAFEEAKRSKLPQIIQSGETDESIKRAIERNTLRRSLIRYEPRSKKNVQKTDNSLVERIKQLTCDVDDINQTEEIPFRASPPGEEARNSPEVNQSICKNSDKSFSPSSSSTASSNSSSMSSTYKKITDLFGKREKMTDAQTNIPNEPKLTPLPDLGNGSSHIHEVAEASHNIVSKTNSTNEPRKQFLSTLAPLTACVSSLGNADEYYYQMNNHVGERSSVASSVGTEYSLEDIDEGLKNLDEESKKIAPDVLAGTPSASESGDELAMFVQQDASRIERIKKKYLPEQPNREDDDDEHDDYGFNRRPSVRGIKPRFGSTTEILQQIQNQLQPPAPTARVAWPYYSESGLTGVDNSKSRNINQNMPNYQYPNVPEEVKTRNIPPQYRPTSLQDENIYQNCTNQRCVREVYRANGNQTYSSFMKVGSTCTEYYQSLPRTRNGRPQSPPPLELSKNYHQTMVYIPYNHIEGYQHNPYYQSNDYVRVSNQNQINKRYIEPVYQQRIHSSHVDEHHYASNMLPPIPLKPIVRIPLSQQPHLMTSRSESPVPGQFSTARSTQTPLATASTCSYYAANPRYRPMVGPAWPTDCNYVAKVNRHSFPAAVPRYPPPDSISLTDSDSQHSGQMPNGYRQSMDVSFTQKDSLPNSPTKPRFLERGVPEGAAASAPSLDTTNSQSSSSTMTSPTSPQNPPHPNQKPLFYAMNV